MKKIYLFVWSLFFLYPALAQTGIPVSEMAECDKLVEGFMETYDIPGATFALAKDGKLVYLRAFGHADIEGKEPTQPYHMFRIASVSKPVTSIAVMKLVEEGEIVLSDKVFGTGGILENHSVLASADISDQRIYNITVQQLLEHSAGWDRDMPCTPNPTIPYSFQFTGCDPIAFPLHVTQTNGTSNPATEEDMIYFLLEKGLNFDPGTKYAYSNIGYLVLGEIIEEVSGFSYEDYVKNFILSPLGICDVHLAKNLKEDKREREGEYVGNGFTIQSSYGTGETVPWEYGGWTIEAMSAHGGWIATAKDLVKLLVAVDGVSTKPDILQASTVAEMVKPSANYSFYAKGWSVNQANNWWHTGGLDGTATIIVRANSGYTWAVLLNKRVIGENRNRFWSDFDNLPWRCLQSVSSFPDFDLMDFPSTNSSEVSFSNISNNEITINWTNGDGTKRILVAKEGNGIKDFPLDGASYLADPAFGNGEDLGNNSFVVFNGEGNSTTITDLKPNTAYSFRLFEYNESQNTGGNPLYLLCNSEEVSTQTTMATSLDEMKEESNWFQLYPTLASLEINLTFKNPGNNRSYSIINLAGQTLVSGKLSDQVNTIEIGSLPPGSYFIKVLDQKKQSIRRIVKLN